MLPAPAKRDTQNPMLLAKLETALRVLIFKRHMTSYTTIRKTNNSARTMKFIRLTTPNKRFFLSIAMQQHKIKSTTENTGKVNAYNK